jgi:hypothetical protein
MQAVAVVAHRAKIHLARIRQVPVVPVVAVPVVLAMGRHLAETTTLVRAQQILVVAVAAVVALTAALTVEVPQVVLAW